jgi:Rod binding domain-containing protein
MNAPALHNLKPFGPVQDGTDLASRPLTQSVRGAAGQYAKPAKDQHEQLVKQTQTWVAQTFFGTLLKQMRNSPFKSELFSGGQGGQAFGDLQDQHMAEHMTRGAGMKLVNGIVRRIEANAAYRKQQQQKTSDAQSIQPTAQSDNQTNGRRRDLEPHDKPRVLRPHASTAR